MELIKIFWMVIFFMFSLTLLFVWSKLYIIAKKVKAIDALLTATEALKVKPVGGSGE
jgi:hypothetical protein